MANSYLDTKNTINPTIQRWTGTVISRSGDQLKVKIGDSVKTVWGSFDIGSEVFGEGNKVFGKILNESSVEVSIQ